MQARGAVHFHAILRADHLHPVLVTDPDGTVREVLAPPGRVVLWGGTPGTAPMRGSADTNGSCCPGLVKWSPLDAWPKKSQQATILVSFGCGVALAVWCLIAAALVFSRLPA